MAQPYFSHTQMQFADNNNIVQTVGYDIQSRFLANQLK